VLKRNLIANYLGQGWTALMGLAFIPLYIKYLGIEAYGLIGLFAVLQAWLTLLDMGMSPTLNREMARFTAGTHSATSIRDLLRSIELIVLGIAVLLALGIWAASGWLASDWLRAEKLPVDVVAQAFAIMGAVTALRFVEGIYRSAIIGLQRQVLFNVVNSAMATLRGLGAVGILIWVSPTIEAFFLWQGLVSILTLGMLASVTYRTLPDAERGGQFSIPALRGIGKFAGGMMLGTLSGLLISGVDKIVISKYHTLSEVGYYTLATTVVSILGILLGPVNQAVFPRFAELMAKGDKTALIQTFINACQLISVFLGSISLVMIFYSQEIIFAWSKDMHLATATAPITSLLSFAVFISSPGWMLYQVQIAHGKPMIGVNINLIVIAFSFPLYFILVPAYGLRGAAYVLIAAGIIGLVLHVIFTFRIMVQQCLTDWAIKSILQPIMIALVIVASSTFFHVYSESRLSNIIFVLVVALFAVLASLAVAQSLRISVTKNIKSLIRSREA